MQTTTLSSRFRVEIPSEIREQINAKAGQTFWILSEKGSIKLIPKKNLKDLKGMLKGMDTTIIRDELDRL